MMDLKQILLISYCLFYAIPTTTLAIIADNFCGTLHHSLIYSGSTYEDWYPFDDYVWYNTTFWDGYMRVALKDNIGPHCKNRFTDDYFLVLTDEHKDIIEFKNNVTVLQACIMSQVGVCARKTTVDVLYCDGDLMYRFSNDTIWSIEYIGRVYICFDKIYFGNCSTPVLDLPAEYLINSTKLVKIDSSITKSGWYDSMFDGKNYTIPLLKDIDAISAICYGDDGFGLYIQDEQYLDIGDVAVGLRVCEFSKSEYYQSLLYQSTRILSLSYICNQHVYVRSCHGKIQLDLTQKFYYGGYKCLVRIDVVKVIPEVRHTVKTVDDGLKIYNQYDPYLQFKCSFKMLENLMYIVKWYLNGHYVTEKGPSRNASVLAIKEDELGVNKLNYKVKCAVSVHSKKRSDPVETTSDDFFAGFKIIDPNVTLSKSGNEIITVEQTVPIGCAYNDISSQTCEDTVSVVDKNLEQNTCSDGVLATDAISSDTQYHSIKTLKQDETWDGMTTFAFKLETVDKTYDDKDTYDLFITHSGTNADFARDTRDAEVRVSNLEYSKNKMFYSHVDPHMRTGNGRSYDQQKEGDFILYRNTFSTRNVILVLERARYCRGNSGPVCACAIIVRAGADAFMINRCNGQPFEVEFIQCGNGGIIEVVRKSDSYYEIYTPIGSKIVVHLLDGWANGRNMNVDIYMSEKDVGHTDGLCGQYDTNLDNDFIMRDSYEVEDNKNNEFSKSWRLKENENLFEDHTIFLMPWYGFVPPICRHTGSITLEKCSKANGHGRRKRREIDGNTLQVKGNQLHITRDLDSRKKRETFINITEEDAIEICKTAIYSSPAVMEFPDKLANENLTVVIGQCVYDVVQGNDASWASAHVAALNNIARNILALNPVFTTNHSDSVETFLSHTCVNNCSGHGMCLKDGMCSCTGMYKGHDCGVDIRIPPLIFDVQDVGYCDDTNVCTCLVVKSDNLFDGFKCHMKTIKVNFNGSYDVIGNSTEGGRYEDLYTGHCCTMSARQKRSDTTDNDIQPFIYGYELSISNDGIHFGIVSSVYFYDDTCVYTEDTSESVLVRIKEGFCFVNDTCIKQGFKQTSVDDDSYCAVCKPEQNKFSLTFAKCYQEDDGQISVAALIGIVIGSLIVLVVILLVVRYVYLKSSKRIRINTEINNRNRTEDISGSGLPDISMFDAAKPRLKTTRIIKPMEDAFTKDEMKARIYLNELVSPNEDDEIQSPRCDDIKYERGLSAVSLKIV